MNGLGGPTSLHRAKERMMLTCIKLATNINNTNISIKMFFVFFFFFDRKKASKKKGSGKEKKKVAGKKERKKDCVM